MIQTRVREWKMIQIFGNGGGWTHARTGWTVPSSSRLTMASLASRLPIEAWEERGWGIGDLLLEIRGANLSSLFLIRLNYAIGFLPSARDLRAGREAPPVIRCRDRRQPMQRWKTEPLSR